MKKIKSIFLASIIACGFVPLVSSCDKNTITKNEPVPVEINSLYDGVVALYQTKNYTFDISIKNSEKIIDKYKMLFRDDFIGYDGESLYDFNGIFNDGKGIYKVNYEDEYITSEYLKSSNGTLAKTLWDNTIVSSMFGVCGPYIKKTFASGISTVQITNKDYTIAFLKTLGMDLVDYTSVKEFIAKYISEKTVFIMVVNDGVESLTYTIELENVGVTSSSHLTDFQKSGSGPFEPDATLARVRNLMLLNNYIHQIYSIDGDQRGWIGYEIMTENYFMTTGNSDTNVGSAYMEIVHHDDPEIPDDFEMNGIYLVNFTRNSSGEIEMAYSMNPINTTPDIVKCQHYPSLLMLWDNLQYVKKGTIRDSDYIYTNLQAERYYFTDEILVNNFAKNNSLDKQFANTTPVAVSLEVKLDNDDAKCEVIFHYIMKYNGDNYDCILPFMYFGSANRAHVDYIYNEFNK